MLILSLMLEHRCSNNCVFDSGGGIWIGLDSPGSSTWVVESVCWSLFVACMLVLWVLFSWSMFSVFGILFFIGKLFWKIYIYICIYMLEQYTTNHIKTILRSSLLNFFKHFVKHIFVKKSNVERGHEISMSLKSCS
jgi:hypothetical protein